MAEKPWTELDDVHVLLVAARTHYDEGHDPSGNDCLDRAVNPVKIAHA